MTSQLSRVIENQQVKKEVRRLDIDFPQNSADVGGKRRIK